ncbi:MAG: hypothetical protein P1V18_05485 [Candidatus Gracilibacteria bacterium]|nr:hypothetical protein [Candidatus Gracilibacteria bacterium]
MNILYGTLGYILITFPYAIIWHMKLFHPLYLKWGYFGEHPSFLLGFTSMIFQGAILSYGYQFLRIDHQSILNGISYSLSLGLFFWSCHVLAAMAKNANLRNWQYFLLETLYLTGQFTFFGILISRIHS